MFNLQGLMEVLPNAGMGWGGVFVVTIVIVFAVELLNRFSGQSK